jgi:pimeloyl-ACP methyl ester carboxylesterase
MAALHAVLDHPDCVSALGLISTTAGGSGLTRPSAAYLQKAASGYDAGRLEATDDLELAVSARFECPSIARSLTLFPILIDEIARMIGTA